MSSRQQGDTFLERFLPAARIDPAKLAPEAAAWLEPLLAAVHRGEASFLLPADTPHFKGFYAGAAEAEERRRLGQQLIAFVGPSHGRVEHHILDSEDPVDAAIAAHTGAPSCWRVAPRSTAPDDRRALRDALDLLRRVLAARPPSTTGEARPLASVLREFEWSLLRADPEASAAALAELERAGLLSLENLRFLEFRRLAALEEWGRLRHDERFDTMVNTRLPRGITDVMLEAVYQVECAGMDVRADPQGALHLFTGEILPRFGPLFRVSSHARSPGALRLALLFAVSREPPRLDLVDELLDRPVDASEAATALRGDLEAIVALASPVPKDDGAGPANPIDSAAQALDRGETDLALRLLEAAPAGPGRAELLVRAAFDVYDLAAANLARQAVDALNPVERDSLPTEPRFRRMLDQVLRDGRAAGQEVTDWRTWLAAVQDDPSWPEAASVAARVADEWDGAPWRADPEGAASFSEALGVTLAPNADASTRRQVRDALPALIRFVARADDGHLESLLEAVRVALILDERRSPSDLDLIVAVTEQQLARGTAPEGYSQLVADLTQVWVDVRSPERVDWALGALDVLSRHPCPNPGARQAFLHQVGEGLAQWHRHSHEVQYLLFDLLAAEFDADWEAENVRAAAPATAQQADTPDTPWRRLDGTVLGIHCLMESAAKRVRELVERLAKPDKVVLDGSHDCSEPLKNLARSADFLLVATQHAKHQATACIDMNAPPSTRVVKAAQSRIGASGLVRALEDALREEVAEA